MIRIPIGSTLIFDSALDTVKSILTPDNPDHDLNWVCGDQPNASSTITPDAAIRASVWNVASLGKTGARAFWDPRWRKFQGRVGKRDLITWDSEFATPLPLASGPNRFCMIVDGKMGPNGIWGVNVESVNGQLRHWLQNQSGLTVYHSTTPADAIPMGSPYDLSLEVLWAVDKTGYMRLRYLNTMIEALNVATLGPDGTLGLAWGLYVGDDKGILPDNQVHTVLHRHIQVWELPKAT